ncbi:TMEM165/GDT1 family protein [Oculatella sp. FACHB-28]|uniref:TMEM165/GDT1 family protein n=1 Tax=Oculatella sp. FACHB-28 TaxID=2692845 RepID=UPI001682E238|nr:TMEM165/GDT1 family protein [Oculatella sp. FACHB-28]
MKLSSPAPGLLISELEPTERLPNPPLNLPEDLIENNLENPQASIPSKQLSRRQEIEIFFSTFFTIFVAELGDKTQLTTLLMSAESNSPWVVFMGSGAALIATSLLGVLLGRWLSSRVSPKVLETATGTILLLVSVLLLWDVISA